VKVVPLSQNLITDVMTLLGLGEPYIRVRTESDYWLYARLFSSTCPVAISAGGIAGVAIAFRSQGDPEEIYIQDLMVHPGMRRQGIAGLLLDELLRRAHGWACRRLYLTSEVDNVAAHQAWTAKGFVNVQGDRLEGGVWVTLDFKGPGKDRAVYELRL
jgi:GNAT superfamily N-acetyltransferase